MTAYYPISYLPDSKAVVAIPTPEAMEYFDLKPWEYGTRRSEWFKSYAEALNYLNHITKS